MAKKTTKTEVKAKTAKVAKAKKVKKPEIQVKNSYSTAEAAETLAKVSTSKFVGTATVNVVLRLKDKFKNESIRGSVTLPHQFGDSKKVVVFADKGDQEKAKKAGADFVGLEDLIEKVEGGWADFDVAIATPSVMIKIAKLGKVLGPKQLMPNPKTGTVTDNVEKAVESFKSGKMNYKMDAGSCIQVKFGKLDMTPAQLQENLDKILEAIVSDTRKYGVDVINRIYVKPTMGATLRLAL
jgi:large subunit ribosomal protein L1